MSNISIQNLASTISEGLNVYSKNILEGVKQAAQESVSEMVQETKQRTSRGRSTGKYIRCIASRAGEDTITAKSAIWYVKDPRYRLTHLLNNGHRSRSGSHVSGDDHVTNAANNAIDKFEQRVKDVIQRESN